LLSKKEREFVEDPFRFSKEKAKVLRHRIKTKLKKAKSDLDLLLQNEHLTGIDPAELLGITRIQHSNACQRNLADRPKHNKGISGFQNTDTKRYGSFSDFENW
jgi:hypothetical protein